MVGKLRRRILGLGGRSMYRHRGLPATLPRARVGFRLQPAPAALPDEPHYPDSSRVVCHSRSGSMRAGSPPSHQDRGDRSPSVLALIGASSAVLRCTSSFARRPLFGVTVPAGLYPWRLKGQNKCASALDGLLPASLRRQQPFHSNPILGCIVSPGAQHAMEK